MHRFSKAPLPKTPYIPGRTGARPPASPAPDPLDAEDALSNPSFAIALDFFHHGFYWEAHEVLEGLWHQAGREGDLAQLLKGIIKLCAAGVKAQQANPIGVRSHTEGAQTCFASLAPRELCTLDVDALGALAQGLSTWADTPELRPELPLGR